MASAPPSNGLPPGFVLDPVGPAPAQTPPQGGRVITGTRPAPLPPSGYRPAPGGYEAVPGGPEDPRTPRPSPPPSGYRPTANGNLEPTPGGPVTNPAGASGEQARMAGFYLRAARANALYGRDQVAPRGVIGQALADTFPRFANAGAGEDRQVSDADQRDFLSAVLRFETGANMPVPEVEEARIRYFPQPGDGPQVIARKAYLRQNAIDGLRNAAGQAANGLDISVPDQSGAPTTGPGAIAGAALHGVEPGGVVGATGGLPPGGPPSDPNRVQPGESMGQVGNLPNVPIDSGRNVAGAAGAQITPHDRQVAATVNALVASRLSVADTVDRINRILTADGRQLLTAGQMEAIRTARQHGARFEFTATARPRNEQEQIQDFVANTLYGHGGAGEAAGANYLDAASFGLPNMLPGQAGEQYRQAMGDMREAHPVASTVGTILGGIASPGGPRPGMGLLEQSGRSMGQGSAYGLFESGGDPVNALVGGTIGAATPGAFNIAGRVARPVTNFLSRAEVTPEAQAIAQAGADEGITLSRPVVDPSVRDRMAYLESSPGTGGRIRQGLQVTREGIEEGADALQGAGTVQPNGVVGQQVQDAGQRYIRRSGDIRTRLYDRAAQIAGDAPVQGQEAVQAIDSALAELAPNAPVNQGQISYLQNLRRTFVDDNGNLIPRTVQSIRDLRTEMRGHIDNGTLTRGPAERRVLNVLSAAKQDIERDLGQANPAAVRAYQRADRFNAERASEIRQVVQRVIGRADDSLSGEQVMTRLRTMAGNRGDADRLARVWDKLSPEEAADAAATIASTAGRRSAEEGFEPGQFIAWARTLSPEARQTIFGPNGAQSIANLRVLSKALMDTTSRLNNSRSGMVANWGRVFRDMMRGGPVGAGLGAVAGGSAAASGGAGLALGIASAGAGLALRRLSARALMNPDMSRWLAGAVRASTPSAIRQHIARLAVVERSNPALTQEITGLRQALLNAVNDNAPQAGSLAASPNEGPAASGEPIEPGNIDVSTRPAIRNQDGTVSTVRSMSFGTPQGEILIPTVVNGRVVSDTEAIANYRRTGQHLGIFRTPQEADAYAQRLHESEARRVLPH